MNIRVALGASIPGVFALVVRQSTLAPAAGVAAGCAGALAAGTAIAGLLFEVQPRDPLVMVSVVMLVGSSGVVAAAAAARRGLRVDAVEALRQE